MTITQYMRCAECSAVFLIKTDFVVSVLYMDNEDHPERLHLYYCPKCFIRLYLAIGWSCSSIVNELKKRYPDALEYIVYLI